MSKKCARCEKTVYPTEELKCLDKIWHKPCFKCKECGMALNMRNYKGFNKEPYCEAHIPKAKATTMAETPELKRIAANTKIQSNVSYHADFEASKGKFTQVADDPEIQRIKQNTKIISNVAYHGDLQRKAEMEQRRQLNENGHEEIPHQVESNNANMSPPSYHPPPPIGHSNNIGKISEYEPPTTAVGVGASPYSSRNSQTLIYSSDRGGLVNNPPQQSHIGSVHDMDPVNHNYGSLGQREPVSYHPPTSQQYNPPPPQYNPPPSAYNPPVEYRQPPPPQQYQSASMGRVYRAMYDYEAQDADEVSFMDGDLIINVSSIDGGWMTGTVKRTGEVGMLPANYVKLATI